MRPIRLAERAARQKLFHDRFNIQYRCTINGIQTLDEKAAAIPPQDADNRQPQAIRTEAAALGKNPHLWPFWIFARVACAQNDLLFPDQMELINNLGMGKGFQPIQTFLRKIRDRERSPRSDRPNGHLPLSGGYCEQLQLARYEYQSRLSHSSNITDESIIWPTLRNPRRS